MFKCFFFNVLIVVEVPFLSAAILCILGIENILSSYNIDVSRLAVTCGRENVEKIRS